MNTVHKEKNEDLEPMRHSASHVLAQAVLKMFPQAKLGIGPAIDNGFYYDFELPRPLREDDLAEIEKEMKRIQKKNLPLHREMMPRDEAITMFKDSGQTYKLDLLEDIPDDPVSVYVTGDDDFSDLCRGPHMEHTGQTGSFKLDRIAGAYWRGDENKPMLQRIYGLSFPTQQELDEYLAYREKLKLIDHRKLGKDMDLFSFHEESPGNVFWHPKGMRIMTKLMSYWRELHLRNGYVEVRTPVLLTTDTWKRSGHLTTFREKMYMVQTIDADAFNYAVKPMNCDGGMLIYKSTQHSYRDLPLRMGEMGVVHRYESSGETHGLFRVREFTQDDAHIFCTEAQIKDELKGVINLCLEFYKTFGLSVHHIELSTRPEKSVGSDEAWEKAEDIMRQVLTEVKIEYQINEGDGAFYGPKFDFHLEDSVGRTWQCGTIQLDFAQPENFELEYIDEKGEKQRPIMIHRVLYGSIERFVGILLENYGGILPLWISPEPVRIIPIADRHTVYARDVETRLKKAGVAVTVDTRGETMQARIRDAELQKVPYVLVVGDKEQENDTISVRPHGKKDTGMVGVPDFIKMVKKEIKSKAYAKK
ncbi:MAG: threonine--tRNA ligase [Candidatus Dojkabacteria bacterium]|nr:threonine--tRNA ligase [Candidatus Dojkabacteria bacterium]